MSTYLNPKTKNQVQNYDDCFPLLRDFLVYIITIQGLSLKTANTYYVNIRLFFRYYKMIKNNISIEDYDSITITDISEADVASVKKIDILNYLYFLANQGNSVNTRGHKLSSLKSFYQYVCRLRLSNIVNPTENIERPRVPIRQPKYLNLTEAEMLLKAAKKTPNPERDFCITTLFLNCGMRLNELVNINVNSIIDNTIKIIGKGNKERTVYLNESCLSAIYEWKIKRNEIPNIIDKEALFISKLTRRRLTCRGVEKIIEKMLLSAGLSGKGYSPHKLRHTAATLMHDAGADVLELKEILGHEHTDTTEIYTHLNNQKLQNVSENNPLNKKY